MLTDFEKTALIYQDKEISYKELIENIKFFSSLVPENTKVAIFSENRPEWIYALFGIWQKNSIAIPIDYLSSKEDVEYIINDASPSLIFCSKNNSRILKDINFENIIIFEELSFKKIDIELINPKMEDIALILYTSGTTGNPKGVMLSFENLYSNIDSIKKENIAKKEDKTIAILPFHHSYTLMVSLLVPLHIGATIIFLPKLSAEDILSTMQKYKITILIGVPRLYYLFHQKIFEKINQNFFAKTLFKISTVINSQKLSKILFKKVHKVFGGNIKFFVSGGAKFDLEVAKDLWALGFKIVEGYGLTETSPIVSFNPPDKIKLGSVGKPIEGVQVKIENEEIVVKGKNVFKGYYNKPEETEKVLKDGWFYTGDLGYIDEEGYLYITGRKKEIIVLPNGKNINPEEIENRILKISKYIKEIAVVEKEGQLFAIIYPDFEILKKETVTNIYETIKWQVIDKYNLNAVSYKKINGFKIVDTELPKTRLGKIKRYKLQELLEEKPKEIKEIPEPQDEEYKILKDYLIKTLSLKYKKEIKILPTDNIEIDLGLDSLDKIELLVAIKEIFGVDITEEELANNLTVLSLSNLIKERKQKIEIQEINWAKILENIEQVEIKEKKFNIKLLKKILKPIFKLYFNLEIDYSYFPNQPFIIAPNHQSYLDGFLIVASLPDNILENTYFLAEESYFRSKFRKFIADNFHIITVNINKDLKLSLQKSAYLLKNGKNIVIFPEGARTRDGNLLPFKKAFAILSKELKLPIIPVTIKGAFESYPINAKFPRPHKIKISYLEPVYPANLSYEEIVEMVKNKIEEKLKN
ncbi:long-chain acyl-CoA synthetase [Venenivibrio stagnispumantis]|uniref:Long-chain acyl-CoA synthetase n=1 Tax=Venenivibrio stagnispumantis TaxID=407998 RepID=A0AA45WLV5_9AQUI|nr:AMP-binding protein [Venenivibrio stagnispumantis]SMP12280.1 long-chain acyl-CoA synthetase [Venenivibrio stagnispumantis]